MKKFVFKILLAGQGGVGKTTFATRATTGKFVANTQMTIGAEFHLLNLEIDGFKVTFQSWDLGGQDRFRWALDTFIAGAKGAILFYDRTRLRTLDNLEEWVGICRKQDPNLPILFVGTKSDRVEDITVATDYAEEFLEPLGLYDHVLVSCKDGTGIKASMENLGRKLLEIAGISAKEIGKIEENTKEEASRPESQRSNLDLKDVIWRKFEQFSKTNPENRIDWSPTTNFETSIASPTIGTILGEFNQIHPSLKVPANKIETQLLTISNRLVALSTSDDFHVNVGRIVEFREKISNLKVDSPLIQDLLGGLHLLLGAVLFHKNKENASHAFMEAGKYYIKLKNLLASQCFFLAAAVFADQDAEYGFAQFEENEGVLSYLAHANPDYTEMVESENSYEPGDLGIPLTYMLLAMRLFLGTDPANDEAGILKSLYELEKQKIEPNYINPLIKRVLGKFLHNFTRSAPISFREIRNFPKFPDFVEPLVISAELLNPTNQKVTRNIILLSPGADRPESRIKVTIPAFETKDVKFLTGRPNIEGNLLYFIEIHDEQDICQLQSLYRIFVRNPKENVRFKDVEAKSLEVREGSAPAIVTSIENEGKSETKCWIRIESNAFPVPVKSYNLSIPGGSSCGQDIALGPAQSRGEGFVNMTLLVEDRSSICDAKTVNFKVKRSLWKIFKKTAMFVADRIV